MIDITQMSEEQKEKLYAKVERALEDYRISVFDTSQGYNILRYAKAGLLEVKKFD